MSIIELFIVMQRQAYWAMRTRDTHSVMSTDLIASSAVPLEYSTWQMCGSRSSRRRRPEGVVRTTLLPGGGEHATATSLAAEPPRNEFDDLLFSRGFKMCSRIAGMKIIG